MINYQLIRSARRKTLSLQVKQGEIIVRAPVFLSDKQIHGFVTEKSGWLNSKLEQQKSQFLPPVLTFTQDSFLWINGAKKKLNITFQPIAQVLNLKDEIRVVLPLRSRHQQSQLSCEELTKKKIKKQLEGWFKSQANSYISNRLPELSLQTNLVPKSFKIRQYKARWGSCNNRDELSFNYLLMMAPCWVVDYVIIHELCHLRYLNHSKEFWQLVAHHYPEFQQAKVWLKKHQRELIW
ncbi:MAG: M48 family metallopeptidase [Colwellia sp.]|nr:M48 family metallopeptidase [Colwellia sp.]